MRLDHLLSKEEEVEVEEALFNYPGSEDLFADLKKNG